MQLTVAILNAWPCGCLCSPLSFWQPGLGLQYLLGRGGPPWLPALLAQTGAPEAWTPEAERAREGWQIYCYISEILEVGE